jgi:hypothetical protein
MHSAPHSSILRVFLFGKPIAIGVSSFVWKIDNGAVLRHNAVEQIQCLPLAPSQCLYRPADEGGHDEEEEPRVFAA